MVALLSLLKVVEAGKLVETYSSALFSGRNLRSISRLEE
jgi:hypothetical protein